MLHNPVLLEESLAYLLSDLSGAYLDLTFGRGSHSLAILSALSQQGELIAIDQDIEAVEYGRTHITDKRFSILHGNYSEAESLIPSKKFNGVLFDLGTCSTHLDNSSRGFSFQSNGPLDMRMNNTQGLSASDWLNHAPETEISEVLYRYGNEKASRKIAKAIIEARNKTLLKTTFDLVRVIESILYRTGRTHPATKTFQAIRIHINDELHHLESALASVKNLLTPKGIVAIISFHSLEDRIVKNFFKPDVSFFPKDIPLNISVSETFKCIAKKIKPSHEEVQKNPRSRSAVMRVFQKI